MFKGEAKSFEVEGLGSFVKSISFKDNKDVIATLDMPKVGVY